MSTTIRRVRYDEILGAPNAQALIDEYGAECSIPLIGKIDQQEGVYAALEQAGLLHCFGVYDGGTLVGFASVLMSILPHYGKRVATVESLFVATDYRTGGTGRALLLALEQYSKQGDCEAILYTAPAQSQLDKLLDASHSYVRTNHVYCRRLQ